MTDVKNTNADVGMVSGGQSQKEKAMTATATAVDKTEKREVKELPQHPVVATAIKTGGQIAAMPEDFLFGKQAQIKRNTFELDHEYFKYRAKHLRFQADKFDARAEEAEKFGSKKDRSAAGRLLKMQSKIDELRTQLEDSGVDVDAMLAAKSD